MLKKLLQRVVGRLRGTAPVDTEGDSRSSADHVAYKKFRRRDYAGSRDREYVVHLPTDHDPAGQPMPLVMVLHGCHEDHEAIRRDTDFDGVADRERFIVVYPFITHYFGFRGKNCWGFWKEKHIHGGRGEVQDLCEIIEEVRREYRVKPDRIHVAGVSAGAAMAVAAMVAHPELIASGASTAGVPYSETSASVSGSCKSVGVFKPLDEVVDAMDAEMGQKKRPVPILIIHSTGDCVVNIRASENLRDAWGKAFGVDTTHPVRSVSGVTEGTPWSHTGYGAGAGGTVVETLFVEGLPHGWYGGRDGEFAFSKAPDTAQLAWDFFQSHPLRA
jgi:poly(hydroxyalkanoate) depolymerase family esterase